MTPGWRWVVEWTDKGEACIREAKEIIAHGRTRFQEYMVAELAGIGKALVIDGKVQSSVRDEHWYHEALVHPVLLAHPCPRRVLILGGGEGATLREVLRHRCVEKAVMVDIDGEIVEAARRHLPEMSRGSFDDPRAELVIEDGAAYIEKAAPGSFDAVILDLVDPMEGGPAAMLYTVEFYTAVKRVLRSGGVLVTQATSPSHTPEVYATIKNTLAQVFRIVRPYLTYVRAYNGLWGFVFASDEHDPGRLAPEEIDRLLGERVEGETRFYDGQTHVWMMSLPKPVRKVLEETNTVATRDNPITVPV